MIGPQKRHSEVALAVAVIPMVSLQMLMLHEESINSILVNHNHQPYDDRILHQPSSTIICRIGYFLNHTFEIQRDIPVAKTVPTGHSRAHGTPSAS